MTLSDHSFEEKKLVHVDKTEQMLKHQVTTGLQISTHFSGMDCPAQSFAMLTQELRKSVSVGKGASFTHAADIDER